MHGESLVQMKKKNANTRDVQTFGQLTVPKLSSHADCWIIRGLYSKASLSNTLKHSFLTFPLVKASVIGSQIRFHPY